MTDDNKNIYGEDTTNSYNKNLPGQSGKSYPCSLQFHEHPEEGWLNGTLQTYTDSPYAIFTTSNGISITVNTEEIYIKPLP